MQPLIVVPANDVDVSGLSLEVDLPPAWITHQVEDASARGVGGGRFEGRLSRSGKADVVVRGKVQATLEVPCARCLEPVVVPVRADLALLLKPRSNGPPHDAHPPRRSSAPTKGARGRPGPAKAASAAEYEFTADEADVDTYDGERVVLDEFVREAMLLELPRFPLCSEDCSGIEGAAGPVPGPSRRAALRQETAGPAPSSPGLEPRRPNPFEALRHLLDEGVAEAPRRPSAAEVRRAAKARSRAKPKMRSSLANRSKK